jgi:hypothetical protein
VSEADLQSPTACDTVHEMDVAVLERWMREQRSQLARLELAVRSARAEAEAAERALDEGAPAGASVDAVLRATAQRLAQELEQAHREAVATVAAAVRLTSRLIESAGALPLPPAQSLHPAQRPADLAERGQP